ncbi:hypothetical protein [Hyphomicrobium sp.]|uniref:hypothetical protein n=1 Tax=Hyphomicrobium sp. TaxID=82 RepID=UPI001D2D1DDF|nr:hypothetical protein [Hyphomicrobium sp.]MBY0559933.1 hypothetical protein [Hyphomicrobium sp.]
MLVRAVAHPVLVQSKTPVQLRVRRPLALPLVALAAAFLTPLPAKACLPGDFACEAFAEVPAQPSKPKVAAKIEPSIADYFTAFDQNSKMPAEGRPPQGEFVRAVFSNFDRLPGEWKDKACRKLYPEAVRDGAIDIPTHQKFFAKCQAFNREINP